MFRGLKDTANRGDHEQMMFLCLMRAEHGDIGVGARLVRDDKQAALSWATAIGGRSFAFHDPTYPRGYDIPQPWAFES